MNLDECDRIFAEVLGATSPSAVCHTLEPLLDQYEVINLELNRGAVFWRARATGESPWMAVSEMGYPSVEYTRPGRLNDENSPCQIGRAHV